MAKLTTAAIQVAYTGTAGRTAQLTNGFNYLVTATTDCYILQGGSGVTATTGNGLFLPKGMGVEIQVSNSAEGYVSAIQFSANGTLTCMRLDGC